MKSIILLLKYKNMRQLCFCRTLFLLFVKLVLLPSHSKVLTKMVGSSSQLMARPHCWRLHLHTSWKHSFHGTVTHMFQHRWYRKKPCKLSEKKHKYQASHKPFDLQWCPAWKICQGKGDPKQVGVTNQCKTWLKAYSRRWKSYLTLLGWLRTWD